MKSDTDLVEDEAQRAGMFYVNQRFIKDRIIYRAVLDAYRHILPNNQFPVVILFIVIEKWLVGGLTAGSIK